MLNEMSAKDSKGLIKAIGFRLGPGVEMVKINCPGAQL